jgi:AraC-like DNA-binding protein
VSVAGSAAVIGPGKTRIIRADNASLSELRRSLTDVLQHASMGGADLPASGPIRAVQDHIIAKLALCLQKPPEHLYSGHDDVVRRALLYLKEHEDEVVYTSNLSMAIGVSERWLRESFHRVFGASPAHLLRVRRLHQARQKLRTGHSVSTAATACGFFDLGRFAMAYRKLFGESPSVTLREGCAFSDSRLSVTLL